MSRRLDVLLAVKALIEAALPNAKVIGLDGADAAPDFIEPGGRVVIRSGDPGEPDVELSPLTYIYQHAIPIEIGAYPSALTAEQVVDAMAGAIGEAVAANRFLFGLVDFLEAAAPLTDDIYVKGASIARAADLVITATYATPDPLN